jgi:hypothetical protein
MSKRRKGPARRLEVWMYGLELAFATTWLRCARPTVWARLGKSGPAGLEPYLSPLTAIGIYARVRNRVIANRELSDPIPAQLASGASPFLRTRLRRPEIDVRRLPFKLRGLAKLAATLKWGGRLAQAAVLYRLLLKTNEAKTVGLTGLGDIYLTEAGWASEMELYRETRTWLDPDLELAPRPFNGPVPKDGAVAFRKALRCFHSAVRSNATTPDLANLARALLEAGAPIPAWLDERLRVPGNGDDGAFMDFRAAALRDWSKAPAGEISAALAAAQRAFRNIGQQDAQSLPSDHAKDWPTARKRFLDNRLVVAEIVSLETACGRLGVAFHEIHPSAVLEYAYRYVFNGVSRTRTISHQLAAVGAARLPNVTDLGFGYFLADDRFLIQDSKHVPRRQSRIFCPWLWAFNGNTALIELSRDSAQIRADSGPVIPLVGHENYYHWLIETAGNCAIWENHEPASSARILTTGSLQRHQRDILGVILPGRSVSAALPEYPQQYRIDSALVSTRLTRDQFSHPAATAFLRRKFGVLDEMPRRPTKLYLTRGTSSRASMVNEPEAREMLTRYGFREIDTARLTVAEQRDLFANCEMIAAPGGAALSNILFCPPSAKVLVFGPETGTFETFSSLAATVGCKSWLCIGRTIETIPHALYVWTQHRFKIDIADLKLCLEEMHA